MHKQEMKQYAYTAAQLNSLLVVLAGSGDEVSSVDRENLIELAEKLSGQVAAFMLAKSHLPEVEHA